MKKNFYNNNMKTKFNDFINESKWYDIDDKLYILKSYVNILKNDNSEKYRIAINYFIVIYNFLIIERMFYDDITLNNKEINKYLTLEKLDNAKDVYNKFLELYDINNIIRNNIETLDSIDSVRNYISKNREKIFYKFL